jgi:transcriptional regulator with XRE-family HTH domain
MKKTFTGDDIRELRHSLMLSRADIAKALNVAPVTIEKWEQARSKPVRPKYVSKLMELGGAGIAGVGIGALAAPALLPVAGVIAVGALGASKLIGDKEIDAAIDLMTKLKNLNFEERQTLVDLMIKMNSKATEK